MQKTKPSALRLAAMFSSILIICALLIQGCQKSVEPSAAEKEVTGKKGGNGNGPHNPPPPPPPPAFYFSNCYIPSNTATFNAGIPVNMTITKNYVNSPGGSYAAFSTSQNGITVSAPTGTFNVGTGSVVFTVTGTPISTGFFNLWISVGNIQACMLLYSVTNAPVTGPTVDPGPSVGSTGVVNFMYKGQNVSYKTVRAGDGKIWLQQNLGSPQVAFHHNDEASYGDYFQWGRWDDGHQTPTSTTIIGGASLTNPSNIAGGNTNFIVGSTATTKWWNTGATSADTWSGTVATSANGKDPCVALGPGWRSPTMADWQTVKNYEDLEGAMAAHMSRLKLPASGFRYGDAGFVFRNGESFYWTATASNNYAVGLFISDNTYAAELQATERGNGFSCRCVKN